MKKTRSKLLAVAMSVTLVMNTLPMSAFAESGPPATGTDVAIENVAGDEGLTTEEAASPSAPGELPGPQGITTQSGEGKDQDDTTGGEGKDQDDTTGGDETDVEDNPAPTPSANEQETPPAALQEGTVSAAPQEGATSAAPQEGAPSAAPQADATSAAPHAHEFGTEWQFDDAAHWHECTAGDGEKADEAAHAFDDWATVKEATETEPGSMERACTVCGYAETAAIPMLETADEPEETTVTEKQAEVPLHTESAAMSATNVQTSSAQVWVWATTMTNDTTQGTISLQNSAENFIQGQWINSGADCTLRAYPKEGYRFVGWHIGHTSAEAWGAPVSITSSSHTFKATADTYLIAEFKETVASYEVRISSEDEARGLVSYSYNGGNFSAAAGSKFFTGVAGASVTAKAEPKNGWVFSAWKENGATVSADPTYSFDLFWNRNLTATFIQDDATVCVAPYPVLDGASSFQTTGYGTLELLKPSEATTDYRIFYKFVDSSDNDDSLYGTGFGGYVPAATEYTDAITVPLGTSYIRVVALDVRQGLSFAKVSEAITYQIERTNPTLSVSSNNEDWGSVSGNSGVFSAGSQVTVKATPNDGYRFVKWTGGPAESTDAEYSFTLDKSYELVAVFEDIPVTHTVTVNANPTEGGTVAGGGQVTEGQETTVAATANAGYGFDGWYESTTLVSSDNPYTFTLTGDVSLTARFKKNTNLVAWDGRNAVVDRDASFRVSFGFNPSFEGMNSEYEKVILTWKGTQIGERDERDANLFHVKASDLQLGDNYLKLTYPGSDRYMPSSDTFRVRVVQKLALSLVDVSPETAPLGKPYTVSGRIVDENGNPLVGKNLYVYVQDAEGASTSSGYSATTGENGAFSFDVSANVPTSPSTFNVRFTVSEDDDYKALAETRTISFVQTHTVTLAANPASISAGLEGGGSYPAGTEITVKAEKYINGIDGFFAFEGWYAGDTKVSGDVAYTFTVTGDTSLTAKFKKMVVFQYTILSAIVDLGEGIEIGDIRLENAGKNLPYEEHGKITLTRNGSPVGQWWNTTNPMFAVDSTELGVGTHTLTLSYPGSDEYFPASTNISVTVVKKLALQLVDFAPTVAAVNNPYIVSGRIVDENGDPYSGKPVTLSVRIGENNFKVLGSVTTDQNGAFSKEISEELPTTPGTRQIRVKANGDDSHKALDESPVVTFRQLPSRMKVTTIGDIEVNKEFTIEATLTDEEGAPLGGRQLIITVNGAALAGLSQTDAQGKVTVAYTPISTGALIIKATYTSSSNDTHAASEDEISEDVSLTRSKLTLTTDDDQYVYGEPVKISGKLTVGQGNAIADKAIVLSVNGKAIEADPPVKTDAKGEFSHTFTPDAGGTYTVKAEFAGIPGSIAGSTAEASFEVLKIKTRLDVSAQVDKSSLVVTVKRTAGATGGIRVFVDDKEYPVEDFTAGEDGDQFTLTIDSITPGQHTIQASYAGDEHYTDAKPSPALIEVPLCYTVHFEPSPPQGWVVNGSMNDQDRVLDDKLRLPKCAFTFDGEDVPVFTGWNTKADGSGDAFADEDARNITDEHGVVVTLYAIWDNPQITTNRLPEGRVGDAYSATLTQVGLAGPKWAISRGELPEGLSLDPDTGIITGTPERACTVSISITAEVAVTDPMDTPTTVTKDLTITIATNVTGITLDSNSAKKDYIVGDALDVTGLTLTVSKSNTSAETLPVTADMVTGFDSSKTGKQTLTVTYEGFTAAYEVEVRAKSDPPAPAPVTYNSTKGDGGTWTKGSGKTLAFTFKRSVDDEKTFGLFTGIEVDGKAVDKGSYTAEAGSAIVRLSPAYLETLPVGSHAIKALFEDGSAAAGFAIAGEGGQLAGEDYHPVTWDPNGGTLSASTYPFEKTSEKSLQPAYKGDALEVLAAPTRSGYTFLHWECDGKEYQPGQEFTVEGSSLVFTAQWKKDSATPTDDDGTEPTKDDSTEPTKTDDDGKDGSGENTDGDGKDEGGDTDNSGKEGGDNGDGGAGDNNGDGDKDDSRDGNPDGSDNGDGDGEDSTDGNAGGNGGNAGDGTDDGKDGNGGNAGDGTDDGKDGNGGNAGGNAGDNADNGDGKDGNGGNAGGDAGGNPGDKASGTGPAASNGTVRTSGSATSGTTSKNSATGTTSRASSTAGTSTKSASPNTGDQALPSPGPLTLAAAGLLVAGISRRRRRAG